MSNSTTYIILGIFVLFLIIYAIIIIVTYHYNTFIFAPYKPPDLPNAYQPLIQVTPLTPEQKQARYEAYTRPPS